MGSSMSEKSTNFSDIKLDTGAAQAVAVVPLMCDKGADAPDGAAIEAFARVREDLRLLATRVMGWRVFDTYPGPGALQEAAPCAVFDSDPARPWPMLIVFQGTEGYSLHPDGAEENALEGCGWDVLGDPYAAWDLLDAVGHRLNHPVQLHYAPVAKEWGVRLNLRGWVYRASINAAAVAAAMQLLG